jgi:RNA recognition motif-containing protein
LRKQREIDDLTKDQRTILVGQLTMKANEGDLRRFFGQIGKVNNIIMIRDKHTGRHKGIGYVEMADLEDIPNCLLFNNCVPDFQKFPILGKL